VAGWGDNEPSHSSYRCPQHVSVASSPCLSSLFLSELRKLRSVCLGIFQRFAAVIKLSIYGVDVNVLSGLNLELISSPGSETAGLGKQCV
jgi:hypothetical protein